MRTRIALLSLLAALVLMLAPAHAQPEAPEPIRLPEGVFAEGPAMIVVVIDLNRVDRNAVNATAEAIFGVSAASKMMEEFPLTQEAVEALREAGAYTAVMLIPNSEPYGNAVRVPRIALRAGESASAEALAEAAGTLPMMLPVAPEALESLGEGWWVQRVLGADETYTRTAEDDRQVQSLTEAFQACGARAGAVVVSMHPQERAEYEQMHTERQAMIAESRARAAEEGVELEEDQVENFFTQFPRAEWFAGRMDPAPALILEATLKLPDVESALALHRSYEAARDLLARISAAPDAPGQRAPAEASVLTALMQFVRVRQEGPFFHATLTQGQAVDLREKLEPAFVRAEEEAKRVVTASHMRQMLVGVLIWSMENDGKWPDSLEVLRGQYLPEFDELMKHPETGEATGFVYLKPDKPALELEDPARTPILFEVREGKVVRDGWVCFADGHVEMNPDYPQVDEAIRKIR